MSGVRIAEHWSSRSRTQCCLSSPRTFYNGMDGTKSIKRGVNDFTLRKFNMAKNRRLSKTLPEDTN
jgi:hypothetical protein